MREIKFRVWDSVDKKMYSEDHPYETALSQNGQLFTFNSGQVWLKVGEEIQIQQFTGVRDKNGKDIYEGDIIKIWNHNQPEFVEWDLASFGFYLCDDKERFSGQWEFLADYAPGDAYEVLGNIHENPDLLK